MTKAAISLQDSACACFNAPDVPDYTLPALRNITPPSRLSAAIGFAQPIEAPLPQDINGHAIRLNGNNIAIQTTHTRTEAIAALITNRLALYIQLKVAPLFLTAYNEDSAECTLLSVLPTDNADPIAHHDVHATHGLKSHHAQLLPFLLSLEGNPADSTRFGMKTTNLPENTQARYIHTYFNVSALQASIQAQQTTPIQTRNTEQEDVAQLPSEPFMACVREIHNTLCAPPSEHTNDNISFIFRQIAGALPFSEDEQAIAHTHLQKRFKTFFARCYDGAFERLGEEYKKPKGALRLY